MAQVFHGYGTAPVTTEAKDRPRRERHGWALDLVKGTFRLWARAPGREYCQYHQAGSACAACLIVARFNELKMGGSFCPEAFAWDRSTAIARPAARVESSAYRAIALPAPKTKVGSDIIVAGRLRQEPTNRFQFHLGYFQRQLV